MSGWVIFQCHSSSSRRVFLSLRTDPPFSPGAAPCPACGTSRSALFTILSDFLCTESFWTLSSSCSQMSLASLSRAFKCSCSSSRSNRSILWYSAVIITFLKATYFWGDRGFKARLCSYSKENLKYYFLHVIKKVVDKLLVSDIFLSIFCEFLVSFPVWIKLSRGLKIYH